MKYEAVFGDQSLFDGAGTFTGIDIVTRNLDSLLYRTSRLIDETSDSLKKAPIVAMRRIIAEPKRWTRADKDAGRSPVYGAILESNGGSRVKFLAENNRGLFHCQYDDGSICAYLPKFFKPIETPEEKAQRLREEWRIKALSSASILSGMQEYELKRLGGYIGDIYDALLSGELPMPGKVYE